MVHEVYDVQALGNFFDQTGGGPYYEGFRYQRGSGMQRGRGLGTLLSRAWRYLLPKAKEYIAPLATEAMRAIGQEGLQAGSRMLEDISKGADVKETIVNQSTKAVKKLAKRAGSRLEQAGSGRKKRKIAVSKRSVKNLHLVGRSVLERAAINQRRKNTLGSY